MHKAAIIIFVRHPELGKVKTRLAAEIGDDKALEVYKLLLAHTFQLIKSISYPVFIFYTDSIREQDLWNGVFIHKRLQVGDNLGDRMSNAFKYVFGEGFTKAIIIGSDCYDLTREVIEQAFLNLNKNDAVIGPAKDGGYYLIGMNAPFKDLFQDIEWSTSSVYQRTIEKSKQQNLLISILIELSDVDTVDDINFTY